MKGLDKTTLEGQDKTAMKGLEKAAMRGLEKAAVKGQGRDKKQKKTRGAIGGKTCRQ